MNRIAKQIILAISTAAMVGCASNTYSPNAEPNRLVAYAAQANYPREITPVKSADLFCSVAPDAVITVWNSGDQPVSGFELWINQMYTLHVDKIDARDSKSFDPATIFNKSGESLKGVPANSINTVQIQTPERLWDIRGPVIQH